MLFGFFFEIYKSPWIKFMKMFEYEGLYYTKILSKTFHIDMNMEILRAICTMFEKLREPPPPKKNSFLFIPVKFQESKYSSQIFDISLFKDI